MNKIITFSKPAFGSSEVMRQGIALGTPYNVYKISLNLTLISSETRNVIIGEDGVLSFQAANFWESRDNWIFHEATYYDTCGCTINNSGQTEFYSESIDVFANAPYLKYNLYLDSAGVYDLWGRGYVSEPGIFWSFDDDTTDLRNMILGPASDPLSWYKFGTIYSTGGAHTFTVYLGSATTVHLDQWYFTQNHDWDQDLVYSGLESSPISALSKSYFNTVIILKGGIGGVCTSWLSSKVINGSGKYNYIVQNSSNPGVDMSAGYLRFRQFGADVDFHCAWDYKNVSDSESFGVAQYSSNYGQTFEDIEG